MIKLTEKIITFIISGLLCYITIKYTLKNDFSNKLISILLSLFTIYSIICSIVPFSIFNLFAFIFKVINDNVFIFIKEKINSLAEKEIEEIFSGIKI